MTDNINSKVPQQTRSLTPPFPFFFFFSHSTTFLLFIWCRNKGASMDPYCIMRAIPLSFFFFFAGFSFSLSTPSRWISAEEQLARGQNKRIPLSLFSLFFSPRCFLPPLPSPFQAPYGRGPGITTSNSLTRFFLFPRVSPHLPRTLMTAGSHSEAEWSVFERQNMLAVFFPLLLSFFSFPSSFGRQALTGRMVLTEMTIDESSRATLPFHPSFPHFFFSFLQLFLTATIR